MTNKKAINLMRELLEFWVDISDYGMSDKDKQKYEQEYYKAFNYLKKQLKYD
tara:strand:+ start:315 stop:470 length:156 start_codon:yes stop_codon:yes gene_type:complete